MPRTIYAALSEFSSHLVDLDSLQVAQARSSRDFLRSSLIAAMNAGAGIPRMTGGMVHFGSFARRTKIRPLDDIDLMFLIDLGQVQVTASPLGFLDPLTAQVDVRPAPVNLLDGYFHSQPAVSTRFLTSAGLFNSTVVLNEIRARLQRIHQYQNSSIARSGVAVVLNLTSSPWVFDIVPALEVQNDSGHTDYFAIPDGRGGWQKTDPRADARQLSEMNQWSGGRLLRLIRLVKFWNARQGHPVRSHHLEVLCVQALRSFYPDDPLVALANCFLHVSHSVHQQCPDPAGYLHDLGAYLSWDGKQRFSNLAVAAHQAVQRANAAVMLGAHASAARELQDVFGPHFPSCV
ncbi:hypothetical protein MF271_16470 [Deinococcus sp. KNUC1210]|uniref:hypothetical protein n=1 Tax=Deinococcus sp. KNUC1210 TaxID=2917691 RepID=UPI001EF0479F|nr:hypothetical protein [Deinococcus sp. KNUC1210]ULH15485.1 hypothetical protein MF271_16470 [Deinococcus sp. KNUC1210]